MREREKIDDRKRDIQRRRVRHTKRNSKEESEKGRDRKKGRYIERDVKKR